MIATMSVSAQVFTVMKGNQVVAKYTADQADKFVFGEEYLPESEAVDLGLDWS